VELSLIQYSEGLTTYQRVIDSQRNLARQEDAFASATGAVGTNLIALYKALGGGWELRLGKDFITEQTREEMRQRTDWGNLLPSEDLPESIEEEPPTGQAIPVLSKPDL
jgi:hypothetical protein